MEHMDSEVPLPEKRLTGALIYNLKTKSASDDLSSEDEEAEYDNQETIEAIIQALNQHGIETCGYMADEHLMSKLNKNKPGLVLNIAEGRGGRAREAQVPCILELLGIPYAGSDATTLCIALDKALTKRILATYHIKSPKSIVIHPEDKNQKLAGLTYPVIVKPNAEGSSKGISNVSIAASLTELRALLKKNIEIYHSDMLVEQYIEGREFTVGVIGNGPDLTVFRPMELVFRKKTQGDYHVYSYEVKQNYKEYITYQCPSTISKEIEKKMMNTARHVVGILGCRDFARMDFRVDPNGEVYFIEINPLPGLAPGYSDYPMLAEFCGVPYDELVYRIFYSAAKRCGLKLPGEGVLK